MKSNKLTVLIAVVAVYFLSVLFAPFGGLIYDNSEDVLTKYSYVVAKPTTIAPTTVAKTAAAPSQTAAKPAKKKGPDYSWIAGKWTCRTAEGPVVITFGGNGETGECIVLKNKVASYGTYYVADGNLYYSIEGEEMATVLDIQPGQRLHVSGPYYFHKN